MKSSIPVNQIALLEQSLQADGIEKVVVGAVILRDHKALLVRRTAEEFMGGLVELPSGGVDPNENILDALIREIKEETNLDVENIQAYIGSFDYVSGSGKKTRQLNFTVSAIGELQLNPEEHDEYFWLSPQDSEFGALNISEDTKKIITTSL